MKKIPLHHQILIGFTLGVLIGILWGHGAKSIEPIGKLFIKLITMVIVPLVFSSIFVGTASLGDIKKLGRIGSITLIYYFITTVIAITIGLFLVNFIKPGTALEKEAQARLFKSYGSIIATELQKLERPSLIDTLLNIVPTNPLKAMLEGNMLQIIFLALLFGVVITKINQSKAQYLINFFDGISDLIVNVVHFIMKLAPYGVFALIASVIGQFGIEILLTLIKYSFVVILGLIIHTIFVLSFNVKFLGKTSPIEFFKGMRQAIIIAFSTSSSNATLPVTMECVETNFKVQRHISSFVLPLGATINMNGTALYQGVTTVFIAQVYGISLSLPDQLAIVLTATLAAIGTAGVPGAGLIMLIMVLRAVNVPLEGIALILGVERILDMCRTVPNVLGDAAAAVIISNAEKRREERKIQLAASK